MIVPAILVEILFACWIRAKPRELKTAGSKPVTRSHNLREIVYNGILWAAPAAVTFASIGLLWGRGSFEASWNAHTTGGAVEGFGSPEDCKFSISLLIAHWECVAAAMFSLYLVWKRRLLRSYCFPLALLLTAAAIHSIHRPWWNYYYLHWAIPLAWLGALGVGTLLKPGLELFSADGPRSSFRKAQILKALALCGLGLTAVAASEVRLEKGAVRLRHKERFDTNPIVLAMRNYVSQTHWVYTDSMMYAFHARCLARPELAVVTFKRYWSGQITTMSIIENCERYQPELLVLPAERLAPEWKPFLENRYSRLVQNTDAVLYVFKKVKHSGEI
jgi:hypothetical protein